MAQWIRVCGLQDIPEPGKVMEVAADEIDLCLANLNGELSVLDNICPHRQGPLGQGWIEGEAVICPWHSWAFDLKTGLAHYPAYEQVRVYGVHIKGEDVLVDIE